MGMEMSFRAASMSSSSLLAVSGARIPSGSQIADPRTTVCLQHKNEHSRHASLPRTLQQC